MKLRSPGISMKFPFTTEYKLIKIQRLYKSPALKFHMSKGEEYSVTDQMMSYNTSEADKNTK
jgi:hypothetical protein